MHSTGPEARKGAPVLRQEPHIMEPGQYWSDPAAHAPSVVEAATGSAQLGWSTNAELTFEEWFADGGRFDEQDPGWAIGDWLSYGVAHFGNCYGAAALATGLARQTLMQMARVARQFAPARRREGVSLELHAVVAELDSDLQEEWLDRAREQQLNPRQLQAQLNAFQRDNLHHDRHGAERRRRTERRTGADRRSESLNPVGVPETTGEQVVTCPHCGEEFAL
jgi:hypothetical protein